MICICCLHDFPDDDLIFFYCVVNLKEPHKKPEPHSGLCEECHKNPYKYPQGIH